MAIDARLAEWVKQGFLDEEAAAEIAAFESGRSRRTAIYTVGGIGAMAVGLGLMAVVASNWDAFGPRMKVLADLLVGLGLAVGTGMVLDRAKGWMSEAAIVVFALYTLASLALLGQVYQSTTPTWVALVLWALAITPLCSLSHGRAVALLWIGACTAGWSGFFADYLAGRINSPAGLNLGLVGIGGVPIFWAAVGLAPAVRASRPALASLAAGLGLAGIFSAGSTAPLAWYMNGSAEGGAPGLMVLLAGLCGVVALAGLAQPRRPPRKLIPLAAVFALAWLWSALALLMDHGDAPMFAAFQQLLFWGVTGWALVQHGRTSAFYAVTALICVRLVVVYVELFGSIFDTGVALLLGGLLTLGLTWLWAKASGRVVAAISEEAP